ncbi:MAG: hypothetical protein ACXVPQ_10955 [Bacteroidia bacterium]
MKKILPFILVLTLVLTNSCRKALKHVDDYYPKVSSLSAVIQSDGSVLVTGQIDSEGAAKLDYAGFCCNSTPQPGMLDRQVICDVSGGKFSAVFNSFDFDSTYYFRSWAVNKYGYKYGTILSISHIIAPAITPPCSLTLNSLDMGTGFGTTTYAYVSAVSNTFGTWDITAQPASGSALSFAFGSAVTTGMYTTDTNPTPSAGHVNISFSTGFNFYALNSGTPVYVNKLGTDTFDITICSAPWQFSSSVTCNLKTHFRSPN